MRIKSNTFLILALLSLFLYSCDAVLSLEYIVCNQSDHPFRLKIHDYQVRRFHFIEDTTIVLNSREEIRIASKEKIGFPWETKKIFKKYPGVDNFEVIINDSVFSIDKGPDKWKYKNGKSYFYID